MEEELSHAKRSNMAASEAEENTEMTENSSPEPSLTEFREMLANFQTSIANILKENKSVKTELTELKAAYQEQKRELESVKTFLESTKKENLLLREELKHTKKKLTELIEETESLTEELDNLEQYTRKNSLEIHGVPEDVYTSTEEVVLKLAEVLDIHILSDDIEISHKLNTRNKSIIVKSLNHKVKTKLYKSRTKLKHIKAADLFPSRNYSSTAGREPLIFINENLTDHHRRIISKANKMRKDQLIQSAWTLDGKIFIKTSPDGSQVRIFSLEDLDNL